jgi:hypothetical protein
MAELLGIADLHAGDWALFAACVAIAALWAVSHVWRG